MQRLRGTLALIILSCSAGLAQAPPAGYANAIREAEEMRARGDLTGIIRTLTSWVEKYPAGAEAQHALGIAYYQQSDLPGAIRHLSAALKLQPENSPAWKQTVETLAMAYYFSSRTADALPLLEKAALWNPRDTYFGYALAMTYLYRRDWNAARRTFAELFSIPPDSPAASVLTAHFMVRENFSAEAAEMIGEAQKKQPDFPDLNFRLGLIALTKGALPEATRHLEKELAANPLHPMAWHYLGDIHIRTGKLDQAINALQRSIWLNLRSTESYVLIATAYVQQGKNFEAEEALKRALELAPQNYEAHFQLARIYHKTNRPELAKREMEIANKLRAESDTKR
jgi:tetratricopeptide (TPR) repeat protein